MTIFLPVEVVSRQIVLIAGRNILVEKIVDASATTSSIRPTSRRAGVEARRGARIMYRDTDRGIRYFVKEGDTRVVSDRATTKAKAMAIGTTIDPSYGYPLPIFGINYLDFEFGGKDSQLAMLFAGVLALGNIQRPKLLGRRSTAASISSPSPCPAATSSTTRRGEREAERVLTWPLSAGANLGYQFTSFQKLSAQLSVPLRRLPARSDDRRGLRHAAQSTTTHGIGAAYEYRRGGYSVVANGTWFGRAGWRPWGPAAALDRVAADLHEVQPRRDQGVLPRACSARCASTRAYFGGRRLDRFSQYQFGLFDETKIHGVPASGVRFGELAMLRGSYSFNVFEQYRFDVFLEGAVGRDRDASRRPRGGRVGTRSLGADHRHRRSLQPARARGARSSARTSGKSFLPARYRDERLGGRADHAS